MQRKRPYTLRELGAHRVILLWYPTVLLGYPLAVAVSGHSQAEGWDFLVEKWGLAVALLVFPLCFIAFGWLMERLRHSLDPQDGPPTAA
jgi:hypothetical protein